MEVKLSTYVRVKVAKTVSDIAEHCGAVLEGDGSRVVVGPADLEGADEQNISFLANPRYAPLLETTRAAAVIVGHDVKCVRTDLALLRVDDPNRVFTKVVALFAPAEIPVEVGVHPSSVVHPSARLGEKVSIGPLCSVGEGAELGDGVVLHAGVKVADRVRIGADTVLHANVVLYSRVELGERCSVHSGTVIGSDGFGYEPTAEGWSKIPQCGTVILGDDVEIGANCAIDRARFGVTRLGNQVKLDNLVQVAHNCIIDDAALIVALVGLAGSVSIGKRAILAGQSGVGGHLTIGAGAQVGGQAGVTSHVAAGAQVTGWPARPVNSVLRDVANMKRVPRLRDQLQSLLKRIEKLESQIEEGAK
ncbi:MAG: UDP-3-O-[3-hydroxymyristoyl] glucosamine N-acyltransferase [Planctomycetota bacterium]